MDREEKFHWMRLTASFLFLLGSIFVLLTIQHIFQIAGVEKNVKEAYLKIFANWSCVPVDNVPDAQNDCVIGGYWYPDCPKAFVNDTLNLTGY